MQVKRHRIGRHRRRARTTGPYGDVTCSSSSKRSGLALQAIWANKLRSLLTVLGNIVAVTSIIAVVSLVQGLTRASTDAIQSAVRRRRVLGAAHAARRGPTKRKQLRAQSNPRVTLEDADAIRAFSPNIAPGHGRGQLAARQAKYRDEYARQRVGSAA